MMMEFMNGEESNLFVAQFIGEINILIPFSIVIDETRIDVEGRECDIDHYRDKTVNQLLTRFRAEEIHDLETFLA